MTCVTFVAFRLLNTGFFCSNFLSITYCFLFEIKRKKSKFLAMCIFINCVYVFILNFRKNSPLNGPKWRPRLVSYWPQSWDYRNTSNRCRSMPHWRSLSMSSGRLSINFNCKIEQREQCIDYIFFLLL